MLSEHHVDTKKTTFRDILTKSCVHYMYAIFFGKKLDFSRYYARLIRELFNKN